MKSEPFKAVSRASRPRIVQSVMCSCVSKMHGSHESFESAPSIAAKLCCVLNGNDINQHHESHEVLKRESATHLEGNAVVYEIGVIVTLISDTTICFDFSEETKTVPH